VRSGGTKSVTSTSPSWTDVIVNQYFNRSFFSGSTVLYFLRISLTQHCLNCSCSWIIVIGTMPSSERGKAISLHAENVLGSLFQIIHYKVAGAHRDEYFVRKFKGICNFQPSVVSNCTCTKSKSSFINITSHIVS
jgi:hypothetical protein